MRAAIATLLLAARCAAQPMTVGGLAWGGGLQQGSNAPPVSPTNYSTLTVWLEADKGVYKDNGVTPVSNSGDPVQQWNDQSGQGNNCAFPFSPLAQWKTNQIGGLPAVHVISQAMLCPAINEVAIPCTVFGVCFLAPSDVFIDSSTLFSGTPSPSFGSLTNNMYMFLEGTTQTGPQVVTNGFAIYTYVMSTNASYFRVRRGGQTAATLPAATVRSGFQISGNNMAEVIYYGRALSSNEVQSVEGYLATKYGL